MASRAQSVRLPALAIPVVLTGAVLALLGGYWDDAWHTERGRDSFFIAPHIALYAGVTLAGGAMGAWVFSAARQVGIRSVLRQPILAVGVAGVGVTLAAAPADNAWHEAFGRDAVLWSPPHVLGIAGTAGVALALLLEVRDHPVGWARSVWPAAGALVLAPLAFLVVEYETDVPQFDAVWYLPVLALGSSLALSLAQLASGRRFAASGSAIGHLLLVGAVAVFLTGRGFDAPMLPLLIFPALVLDVTRRRGQPLLLRAAAYVGVLYAVYVPGARFFEAGTEVTLQDAAVGIPVAVVAVALVMAAVFARPPAPSRAAAITSALGAALVVLTVAPSATAHDPGQGDVVGSFDLVARVDDRRIALRAHPHLHGEVTPLKVVARRAGQEISSPLRRDDERLHGELTVPEDGRWFVYAVVERGQDHIESWLPVKVGDDKRLFVAQDRFAYIPEETGAGLIQWMAGIALYAVMLGYLTGIILLSRRAARDHPPPPAPRATRV